MILSKKSIYLYKKASVLENIETFLFFCIPNKHSYYNGNNIEQRKDCNRSK